MPRTSDSDNGRGHSRKGRPRIVLVDGDVTIDCHIATSRGPSQISLSHKPEERVPFVTRLGGASLLADLIKGVAHLGKTSQWQVVQRPFSTDEENFPRLYTVWYHYESHIDKAGWRISKFLGSDTPKNVPAFEPLTLPNPPDLIVIDDKGRRFRKNKVGGKTRFRKRTQTPGS